MIRLARIPTLGFNGFDFDLAIPPPVQLPPPGDLPLGPAPAGNGEPPPPAPPPAEPPPPVVQPEEFQFLFPVGAALIACPVAGGMYNLIDPASGTVVAQTRTVPPGAVVVPAGDPRCGVPGYVSTAPTPPAAYQAPAQAAYPEIIPGVSNQTLVVGGLAAAAVVALLVLT